MKKLFYGICFIFMSFSLKAQHHDVIIQVLDQSTQQPLPSATVEIVGAGIAAAGKTGKSSFPKLASGKYKLVVSAVGYIDNHSEITVPSGLITIALEPAGLFLQPVEILALRANDKAPFAKVNIQKYQIEKSNLGQDLPFLLAQTPSIIVNSDAGNGIGYTGIRIRGTDATRINMTINGIPYNDAESQGLFFVNLPDLASSVQSIQVQRGVGTSTNGAGAFGATMNFSTNEVNLQPEAEINNSFGSFNTFKHTVKASSGLLGEKFTVDARLSSINSNGYIDRATTDLKSFYFSTAYLKEKTAVRLNIISGKERTYQAWNGISEADLKTNRTINYAGMERPGKPYENETDNYLQSHYQFFINHSFSNALSFNTAAFYTRGNGYYEQYKAEREYSEIGLPDITIGGETIAETDLIRQLKLDNHFYGQVFTFQYKKEAAEISLGGGWNVYKGNHIGKILWAQNGGVPDNYTWYNHPANKKDRNIYLKMQHEIFNNLSAFVDFQYRSVQYTLQGFRDNPHISFDNNYNFFNPKFGLTYSAGQHQVFASWSRAAKEPNRDDFEAGINNVPKPEILNDFEAGWESSGAKYAAGINLYYMQYKDQLVLTGKINDVGAYTRTNIPDSYRMGIELHGSYLLNAKFTLNGNLTLSNNRIKNFTEYYDDYDNGIQGEIFHGDTYLSYSPAVTALLNLNIRPAKHFEISLPARYVSRQYLDNTSDKNRSLQAFYNQDVLLSYSIPEKITKNIRLLLQINNLWNKKYEPNGYTFSYFYGGEMITENYYFPMAGTNFMFGLNIKL